MRVGFVDRRALLHGVRPPEILVRLRPSARQADVRAIPCIGDGVRLGLAMGDVGSLPGDLVVSFGPFDGQALISSLAFGSKLLFSDLH